MLTHSHELHAAYKQLTGKAPEATALADQATAPEITTEGHQGLCPFSVSPLHRVLLSSLESLGFGIQQS